ncbi:beta-lactamase family protein [Croceibacterium sp. LX-88]|uniref:Beta-lactamase family protein n=1 Tax=Croceibacterium selenioxidans TaxID=2838833 RepID=A0ABS5W0E3_9SPHN|nr:serine hydrolase domain-containing protein [Croceibacterium selenioxidans]MBT2133248.1 beta-lactamase family protein [Croceibacterium selenioxidans]
MQELLKDVGLTRRQCLGGAAMLGAGALLPGIPAFAQAPAAWPNVTRLISSYVDSRKVANMVVTLGFGQEDPMVIAAGVDSFTGPRQSDGRSIYRIYSMTKPITGMAAISLIDEGKLGLDQPLYEILPKYRNMQVQKVYDGPITPDNLEPAIRPITIRQMLTHTAGIGYGIVQQGPIATAFRENGIVPGMVTRLQALPIFRGTPVQGLDVFADRLAEMPLVYQPGTRWSYSMALDLMGRVIEVVSGQPFDRFLQERFFDPLTMADTGFQVPRENADRMTTSYFLLNGTLLPIDLGANSIYFDKPPFPFGGAGLASTPLDYDKFLKMLVGYGETGGLRVISEQAVRLGTSNILPNTILPEDDFTKTWDFGAGARVGRGDEAGVYGWAGAAGTIGFVHLPLGLRAGLFTQYMPQMEYPLLEEFPAAIRADLAAMGRA